MRNRDEVAKYLVATGIEDRKEIWIVDVKSALATLSRG